MIGSNRRLALAGLALFAGSRWLVRDRPVSVLEGEVFRAANDAPDGWRVPVRSVMQAGTFVTVPAVATAAFLARRRRLAAELAIGGTAAWLLTKAAKPLGGRARPEAVVGDVNVRETIAGDLGWVSGHTAVSTTLALLLAPHVPRPAQAALGAVIGTTAFGRMYVGAHLPLDLVGGAGLGMSIVAAIRAIGRT